MFVSACDVFAETALVSLAFSLFLVFFEIKNSILSVARYTRGIVYFVTHTGRRISLQYVNVRRTLRNHDFPGFSGCIRLQLDGSIVTLSSGADHAEIKVLKFHREARKGVWKTDENASRICPLALVQSSQASTLRDININTVMSCVLYGFPILERDAAFDYILLL